MSEIVLTSHQQDALAYLLDHLDAGASLVALRGLAGTGKTTLIPSLRAALMGRHKQVAVGTPTHRAAMILRRKGISSADTVHTLALMPYFTADYRQACAWLGEPVPALPEDMTVAHDDIDGLPWLVYGAVKPDCGKGEALLRLGARYKAQRKLASVGIHGQHYFAGFGPKADAGDVLILDEASMVGASMLALCQQAFAQIVLVGDPGQLQPVNDTAILASIEGFDLTEIHRQAQDSPIIQLAYRARQHDWFWQKGSVQTQSPHGDIVSMPSEVATKFLEAPLIVWRNEVRIDLTKKIRAALGYPSDRLMVGEPLVCRSTNKEDRALGFYNNGLYRIVEIDANDPRAVVVEDALGEESSIVAHMEELDGDGIPPRAIPFRFGYCLTAHTAQGGEWPTVYISLPDLRELTRRHLRKKEEDEIAKWSYTAITRAKQTLCFLTEHTFRNKEDEMAAPRPGPTTAPTFALTAEQLQTETVPDDIPDPAMPPAVVEAVTAPLPAPDPPARFHEHEALLVGFCEALQKRIQIFLLDEHSGLMRTLDATLVAMRKWVETVGTYNEHAQYQLGEAVARLQEHGIQITGSPYQATVTALSPEGYQVRLALQKPSASELVEELGRLIPWLKQQNYSAVETTAIH